MGWAEINIVESAGIPQDDDNDYDDDADEHLFNVIWG